LIYNVHSLYNIYRGFRINIIGVIAMAENISDRVGARIREYRKRAGMTQENLALSANMGVSFLGDVERGKKKPSIDSLEKILSVLNVSFEEFFSFAAELKPYKDSPALEKLTMSLRSLSNVEIETIYNIVTQILFLRENIGQQKNKDGSL